MRYKLSAANQTVDEQIFTKMKDAYAACLDDGALKKIGLAPLKEVVKKVIEIFPPAHDGITLGSNGTFPNRTTTHKNLPAIIKFLSSQGVGHFVGTGTGADQKDPDTVIVSVGAPSRFGPIANERMTNATLINKYKAVIHQVMHAVVGNQDIGNLTFEAIVDFEKRLIAILPTPEERRDITVS